MIVVQISILFLVLCVAFSLGVLFGHKQGFTYGYHIGLDEWGRNQAIHGALYRTFITLGDGSMLYLTLVKKGENENA